MKTINGIEEGAVFSPKRPAIPPAEWIVLGSEVTLADRVERVERSDGGPMCLLAQLYICTSEWDETDISLYAFKHQLSFWLPSQQVPFVFFFCLNFKLVACDSPPGWTCLVAHDFRGEGLRMVAQRFFTKNYKCSKTLLLLLLNNFNDDILDDTDVYCYIIPLTMFSRVAKERWGWELLA